MDFAAIVIFLALYYLRPQEWASDFALLRPVQILSFMAVWAMIQKENYKRLLKTPLDWLVLSYFVWTLVAGFQFQKTLGNIEAVLLFYFVAACALDTIPKIKKFLGWWCLFIFMIAALAVATEYGFDPLHSQDLTNGAMKGRLILNLSIFDNPNSLAHSIVPAIPLFYYLLYWRNITKKMVMLLLLVPLYCIFLTQSKGAFLCGGVTLLATLTFGRSKIMQIAIFAVALAFGTTALYMLPRMNELHKTKLDPAIQGRVAALNYGLTLMRSNFFGIGLGNFQSEFLHHGPMERYAMLKTIPSKVVPAGGPDHYRVIMGRRIRVWAYRHFSKATHGAYNQNGAELGYVGLFLFVSILYCCVRTLLLVKSKDDDEERIRRALFAMTIAYASSSWMVDFTYRPTFLLMVAAISAFHRHLLRKHGEEQDAAEALAMQPAAPALRWPGPRRPQPRRLPPMGIPGLPGAEPAFAPALGLGVPGQALASAATPSRVLDSAAGGVPLLRPLISGASPQPLPLAPAFARTASGPARGMSWNPAGSALRKQFKWTRLGLLDLGLMVTLTYCAILYWQHLIKTM